MLIRNLLLIGWLALLLPTVYAQSLNTVTIAKGLEHPWSVVFLSKKEMLVSERTGKLKRISTDGQRITQITGVPKVLAEGQGGLLGLAIDPQYSKNQLIYMAYAEEADGKAGTAVAKAKLIGNELDNVQVIFQQAPKVSGSNHFGSRLVFDRQGDLFVTLGERFFHMKKSQLLDNHFGKVVKIKTSGKPADDNPFLNTPQALPEIWSYGHRNIQGAVIHPVTGKLWIHEHGPKGGDEINIPEPAKNYGWPNASYGIHYWLLPIKDDHKGQGFVEPIHYWTPSIAPCGMMFYTGDKFPEWKNNLFVGALAGRHLARLVLDGQKVISEEKLLTDLNTRIRDVANGPDGFIYLLTDDSEGKVVRLEPRV